MLRLALVGAGRWGRNYIRTIAGLAGMRLVRVASGNPETAALVPPGCVVEPDWRKVAAAPDVDAVIVATPPSTHAAIAIAALEAGKAVLVEKPLTMDPAEAEAVAKAAIAAGRTAWVEHTQLFNPAWIALKQVLPTIGEIRAIRSVAGNFGPFRPQAPVLWDWGPHDVAMTLDLLGGMPLACSARLEERRQMTGGWGEMVALSLSFADGLEARIRCGNLLEGRTRRYAVHGEGGILVMDDVGPLKLTRHPARPDFSWPDQPGEALAVEAEMPLTRAVRRFAEAVAAGAPPDLDLGVAVVRLLAGADKFHT